MLALFFLSSIFLCSHALHLLEGEQPYSPVPLSALYHTPSHVTKSTVNRLLDLLQEYQLTQFYGVYALHTHLRVAEDEVLYLTQAPEGNFTSISVLPYPAVRDSSIPVTHQLSLEDDTVSLLPIEHGPASSETFAARLFFGEALSNGLLEDLAAVLSSVPKNEVVGLSQILPIHRNALSKGHVVLNQLPQAHGGESERQVATIVPELGGASLGLFTRGEGRGGKRQEDGEGCEVAAGCAWRASDGETC